MPKDTLFSLLDHANKNSIQPQIRRTTTYLHNYSTKNKSQQAFLKKILSLCPISNNIRHHTLKIRAWLRILFRLFIKLYQMKIIPENFAGKKFFFMSLSVTAYFCLLYLNTYIVKSNSVLIGIFQELLTLPLILFQLLLLILSILYCIKDKFRIITYSFWSFLILLISNLFIFKSFI